MSEPTNKYGRTQKQQNRIAWAGAFALAAINPFLCWSLGVKPALWVDPNPQRVQNTNHVERMKRSNLSGIAEHVEGCAPSAALSSAAVSGYLMQARVLRDIGLDIRNLIDALGDSEQIKFVNYSFQIEFVSETKPFQCALMAVGAEEGASISSGFSGDGSNVDPGAIADSAVTAGRHYYVMTPWQLALSRQYYSSTPYFKRIVTIDVTDIANRYAQDYLWTLSNDETYKEFFLYAIGLKGSDDWTINVRGFFSRTSFVSKSGNY
jgi:hypothetical protein